MKIAPEMLMGADAPIPPMMMNARRPKRAPRSGIMSGFSRPCRREALIFSNFHVSGVNPKFRLVSPVPPKKDPGNKGTIADTLSVVPL